MRKSLYISILLLVSMSLFAETRVFNGDVDFIGKIIVIPQDETWIFNPGTKVFFDGDAHFVVYGGIKVLGETKKVTFTTAARSWKGISLVGTSQPLPFQFEKPIISGSINYRKIINGLEIKGVSNPSGSVIHLKNSRALIDRLNVTTFDKTAVINIEDSDVVISNTQLLCTGSSFVISSKNSVLLMHKVYSKKSSSICPATLNVLKSTIGLFDVQINGNGNGIVASDSRIFLEKVKSTAGGNALTVKNSTISIKGYEGISKNGAALQLLTGTIGVVEDAQFKKLDKVGCGLESNSNTLVQISGSSNPSKCIGLWHNFSTQNGLSRDTAAQTKLKQYVRTQKLLPYTNGDEWKHLAKISQFLVQNPKKLKLLKKDDITKIKNLSKKAMGSLRTANVCIRLKGDKSSDVISKDLNSFLPSNENTTDFSSDLDCPKMFEPIQLSLEAMPIHVDEIKKLLLEDYTRAINQGNPL